MPQVRRDVLDRALRTAYPHLRKNRTAQLQRLGLHTLRDLLFNLPRDYSDRRVVTPAAQAQPGQPATFAGYLSAVRNIGSATGLRQTATIYDSPTDLKQKRNGLGITWYGQHHLAEILRGGDPIRLHGTVLANPYQARPRLHHPEYDLPAAGESINTGIVAPIYRLTKGLTQETLRRLSHRALCDYAGATQRSRPGAVAHTLSQILWTLHFPLAPSHPAQARHELASDEILELQLALLHRRHSRQAATPRAGLSINPELAAELVARLPFTLTDSQQTAAAEIRQDLVNDGATMNRLLQGEVGSGKTAVALHAVIDTASAEAQSALLAPTELLAEQHCQTLTELLQSETSPLADGLLQTRFNTRERPFTYALLTASVRARTRRAILQHLALGTLDLIIGTHSILSDAVQFRSLGLTIVDEQHRFGASQRAALRQSANYLMLTATPIPRTLQLTLYRDLDVSAIQPRPHTGRAATTTTLLGNDREPAYQAIAEAIAQGHQAFIIAPFIEPSEAADAASVSTVQQTVNTRFPDLSHLVLHGQLSAAELEKRMKAVRDRQAQIIIATAVVEVGIDLPNTTVMLIESAERFGMAQLHQLRGRIGRGAHPGQCFLAITPGTALTEHATYRLETVQSSTDGMELAHADLSNRGEGHLGGTQQSGPGRILKTGNAYDLPMLEAERDTAEAIHAADPELQLPDHAELRRARDRMLDRLSQESNPK